jgi:hypothetical protein
LIAFATPVPLVSQRYKTISLKQMEKSNSTQTKLIQSSTRVGDWFPTNREFEAFKKKCEDEKKRQDEFFARLEEKEKEKISLKVTKEKEL